MSFDGLTLQGGISLGLLLIQIPAVAILLSRLVKGPFRHPPIEPQTPRPEFLGAVSVLVPTLNEAERIGPCLAGLTLQSYEVREILVVDSHSQDGTPELVKAVQQQDPRFRLMTDDPLPDGWVGRPWALHSGFLSSSEQSHWILGIDADTQPNPGLVAGLVKTAEAEGYDLVSLSPQFILKSPGEWWLQPALLLTLVYRFGPAGDTNQTPKRVMANGQCFLCRRSVLSQLGGYTSARASFCDDVTLARNAAAAGFKVGFLDGAKVLKVRMYEGALETWHEWGRSLDLKDASDVGQIWSDLWLLLAVQGLPVPVIASYLWLYGLGVSKTALMLVLGLNLFLLAIRVGLLFAIAPSYEGATIRNSFAFFLSPLADPLAFLRILLSSFQTPSRWRGRSYNNRL
ncbi:MAG: glycosyltransferase family 2 protein [Chamaesiphon sp.]